MSSTSTGMFSCLKRMANHPDMISALCYRTLAFLLLAFVLDSVVAQSSEFHREQSSAAIANLAEAFLNGPVEGRFLERSAGVCIFVPSRVDFPHVPLANPSAVSEVAAGPLLQVYGKIDVIRWTLTIKRYELQKPAILGSDALPESVRAAGAEILK